jgi:predicted HTH domain antitoxin
MTLTIEDDLTTILQGTHASPEQAARELIVLELFRQHRISGGRAAELLNVSREDFIRHAADAGIPYFDFTPDQLKEEIDSAKQLARARRL